VPETHVDLTNVIRDLVTLNARTFEQKRIRVRPIVQGSARTIRAREMDVYLILWNILHNAAKFTRGNKPSAITITEQYSSSSVVVKIRDEGVGIPPEHRNRIWENDFSTAAPGANRHTSGRGLFTVAHLVSRIQGSDIQVSSIVNKGTEFTWIVRQGIPI
jgi:signal transduction histidine kinase